MGEDFIDWSEDYSPFDAIGFAVVGAQPPSQKDFAKAVHFARFVTDSKRVSQGCGAAPKLPYTRAQVEIAVKFFTQSGGSESFHEYADELIWQWAFESIILRKYHGKYVRTWAPEKLRLERVLLDEPIVTEFNHVSAGDDASNDSERADSQEGLTDSLAHDESIAPAAESTAAPSMTYSTSPLPPDSKASTVADPSSTAQVDDSSSIPTLPIDSTSTPSHTTKKRRAKCASLKPGSFHANRHIFVGFHREQLLLAGDFSGGPRTHGNDYRQTVYASVNNKGILNMRMRKTNIGGSPIPSQYQIRNEHAYVYHDDIIYIKPFRDKCWQDVRLEVARLTLSSQEPVPNRIPTPDAESEARDDATIMPQAAQQPVAAKTQTGPQRKDFAAASSPQNVARLTTSPKTQDSTKPSAKRPASPDSDDEILYITTKKRSLPFHVAPAIFDEEQDDKENIKKEIEAVGRGKTAGNINAFFRKKTARRGGSRLPLSPIGFKIRSDIPRR